MTNELNIWDEPKGWGMVKFFMPTESGSGIFVRSKKIEFEIDMIKGLNQCFAEGIRKACLTRKESNKLVAEYELTGTTASCDFIFSDTGGYLNSFPLLINNWEKYGVRK